MHLAASSKNEANACAASARALGTARLVKSLHLLSNSDLEIAADHRQHCAIAGMLSIHLMQPGTMSTA